MCRVVAFLVQDCGLNYLWKLSVLRRQFGDSCRMHTTRRWNPHSDTLAAESELLCHYDLRSDTSVIDSPQVISIENRNREYYRSIWYYCILILSVVWGILHHVSRCDSAYVSRRLFLINYAERYLYLISMLLILEKKWKETYANIMLSVCLWTHGNKLLNTCLVDVA
jgi:hypothetical protein